MKLKIV